MFAVIYRMFVSPEHEQADLQEIMELNEAITILKIAIAKNKPYNEIAMEIIEESKK